MDDVNWVLVSERLPEVGDYVMIETKDKGCYFAHYTLEDGFETQTRTKMRYWEDEVVRWFKPGDHDKS
jgi:hypothetical protein